MDPDAIKRRLYGIPGPTITTNYGVTRYPLGPCTISLSIAYQDDEKARIQENTNLAFTLEIDFGADRRREIAVPAGFIELSL